MMARLPEKVAAWLPARVTLRMVGRQVYSVVLRPLLLILAGAALLMSLLFIARGEGPESSVSSSDQVQPIRRMAESVLFRTGAIRMMSKQELASRLEPYVDQEELAEEGLPVLSAMSRAELRRQLRMLDLPAWRAAWPAPFHCEGTSTIRAIAAVESYMRPVWFRQIEFALANASLTLFGRAPDWSYGYAQLRVSTVLEGLATIDARWTRLFGTDLVGPLPPQTVYGFLQSACDNLALAQFIAELRRPRDGDLADVASAYRGGPGRELLGGSLSYQVLVAEATTLLDWITAADLPDGTSDYPHEIPFELGIAVIQPDPAAVNHPLACLRFGREPGLVLLLPRPDPLNDGDGLRRAPRFSGEDLLRDAMARTGTRYATVAPDFTVVQDVEDTLWLDGASLVAAAELVARLEDLNPELFAGAEPLPMAAAAPWTDLPDGCVVTILSEQAPDPYYADLGALLSPYGH